MENKGHRDPTYKNEIGNILFHIEYDIIVLNSTVKRICLTTSQDPLIVDYFLVDELSWKDGKGRLPPRGTLQA